MNNIDIFCSIKYIYIYRKVHDEICIFWIYLFCSYTRVIYMSMFPACCFRQRTCVAQSLLNGVLNETWTHSCFQYKWILSGQICFYKGFCAFFLECVYFGLLYLSLIFDMFIVVCVCVCVCVCVGVVLGFTNCFFLCIMGCFVVFKFIGSSSFLVSMFGIRSS